jgi:predicted neutral ceramidase superfamily lipid hydrolase
VLTFSQRSTLSSIGRKPLVLHLFDEELGHPVRITYRIAAADHNDRVDVQMVSMRLHSGVERHIESPHIFDRETLSAPLLE